MRYFITLLLLSYFCPSQAQSPMNAMRLFTTAKQRNEMNRLRNLTPEERAIQELTNAEKQATREMKNLTNVRFNGIVMRKNGAATIWINGQNQEYGAGYAVEEPRLNSDSALPMLFETEQAKKQTSTLKPGQVWNAKKQAVQDSYKVKP